MLDVPPGHTAFSWCGGAKQTAQQPIGGFVADLASKQPTPGGGAAAAVGAAVGAAAAQMAAAYSQRKKDVESGAAAKATELISALDTSPCLALADQDAEAYADLQRTWKDAGMPADEKANIEARALAIPAGLVRTCHQYVLAVQAFLPHCNPNITSDAKVGIHLLSGAASSAFQTVLVNSPRAELREELLGLLREIRAVEDALLDLGAAAASETASSAKSAGKGPAQQPKQTAEEKAAKEAAKAREKLLKAVVKEGGKKGVEIEGASDMGGLDFFCTTIESPDGEQPLLMMAMDAMNAQPAPDDEERKGCSGHVGKMIFSAGAKQLAIVAYVPKPESNKSADKVPITEWIDAVAKAVDGTVTNRSSAANSPHGGHVAEALVVSDPDKGKFALKDKDAAMAAAFNFLRSKVALALALKRARTRALTRSRTLTSSLTRTPTRPPLLTRAPSPRTTATIRTTWSLATTTTSTTTEMQGDGRA